MNYNNYYCLIFLAFISMFVGSDLHLSCRDEDGNNVDWFYLYKLPKNFKTNMAKSDKSGLSYLYITSKHRDKWELSNYKINDTKSMAFQTLHYVLSNSSIFLIAYNDQFPNGTTIMSGGHAKGVVATDSQNSMWLIHSVPKFPAVPSYVYPSSGATFGQSFLCLSLSSSEMNKLGQLLIYNEINIYHSHVPEGLKGEFPTLEEALQRKRFKKEPYKIVLDLNVVGGKKFRAFAKNKKFNADLYEDLVAPTLDANMMVESWRNGGGNMASNCSNSDKVFNIATIKSRDLDVSFSSNSDHSKWAVTEATGIKLWRWRFGGSDWICIGDINRQNHQRERGGGTVCQKSSKIAQLYRDLIGSFEPCNKNQTLPTNL